MIVWTVPRETNASPPEARTRSATASTSASVASRFITTTMSFPPFPASARRRKTPGSSPGVVWSVGSGDYPGQRPKKKSPKPTYVRIEAPSCQPRPALATPAGARDG